MAPAATRARELPAQGGDRYVQRRRLTDLSHVRVEAGYRFTQNPIGLLEAPVPQDNRGQAQQRGSPANRCQTDRAADHAGEVHTLTACGLHRNPATSRRDEGVTGPLG